MPEELARRTWPEVPGRALLVVPVGSVEQHGPHLPLDTDTRIATATARGLADRLDDAVLGPPIAYGASGEHEDFPGTVSIGTQALHLLVVELGRSASRWAPKLLLLNGHGGNATTLAGAVSQLRDEQRDAAWAPCAVGGDAHAGHTETSLLLHLDPSAVDMDRAVQGNTAPITKLMPALRRHGTRAVSANGVLGDPTTAHPHVGAEQYHGLVARLVAAVERWAPDANGMLR